MPTKYEGSNKTKGKIDRDDDSNVLDPKDLDDAANAGAEAKGHDKDKAQGKAKGHDKAETKDPNAPNREPLQPGTHLPGADFRTQVENTAAGDLNWDPKAPYPVGDPPDPREEFHRIHGYYKDDEADQDGPNIKRRA